MNTIALASGYRVRISRSFLKAAFLFFSAHLMHNVILNAGTGCAAERAALHQRIRDQDQHQHTYPTFHW